MEGSGREGGEGGGGETGGGFLFNGLSSPLYNILRLGFFLFLFWGGVGEVGALGFVLTQNAPPPQTEKDTMNSLYFLHRRDTHTPHKKRTALPARLKNVLVTSQGI